MAGNKQHEVEIEIASDGETTVHVKGLKGKKCEDYQKFFEGALGKVHDLKRTSEYYETDSGTHIDIGH
jgi:hypothetical protein